MPDLTDTAHRGGCRLAGRQTLDRVPKEVRFWGVVVENVSVGVGGEGVPLTFPAGVPFTVPNPTNP